MNGTDEFDGRIRPAVFRLVDSAPPPPPFPDASQAVSRQRAARKRRLFVAVPLVVVVLGSAAAAAIPALQQTSPGVTRLFIRSSPTGVQIRAYLVTGGGLPTSMQGELSTEKAIGELSVDSPPFAPRGFAATVSAVFGQRDDRATAVAVHTGSDVGLVKATFANGTTDEMHPVGGWAILGAIGAEAAGTVVAFGLNGERIGSQPIPAPTSSSGGPSEPRELFNRVTNQGIVVIGHDLNGYAYPYLADRDAAQLGIEGYPVCPTQPDRVEGAVAVAGVREGDPMTVLIIHAGRGIARVKVTYANGVEDAMNTVSGQAVLATLGTIAKNGRLDTLEKGTIEGFDGNGRLRTRVPINRSAGAGSCF
ncbi:MAG: hypothetical protein WB770_09040 [Acidimicrobiales bacterium]